LQLCGRDRGHFRIKSSFTRDIPHRQIAQEVEAESLTCIDRLRQSDKLSGGEADKFKLIGEQDAVLDCAVTRFVVGSKGTGIDLNRAQASSGKIFGIDLDLFSIWPPQSGGLYPNVFCSKRVYN
jgi:hypothetical protein